MSDWLVYENYCGICGTRTQQTVENGCLSCRGRLPLEHRRQLWTVYAAGQVRVYAHLRRMAESTIHGDGAKA